MLLLCSLSSKTVSVNNYQTFGGSLPSSSTCCVAVMTRSVICFEFLHFCALLKCTVGVSMFDASISNGRGRP